MPISQVVINASPLIVLFKKSLVFTMIATPQLQWMSVTQYLEWEAKQQIRHEYLNGHGSALVPIA